MGRVPRVMVLGALLAGCDGTTTPPQNDAGADASSALRASADQLDFGETPCGERAAPKDVELTNLSSTALTWTATFERGTPARYEVSPAGGELAPGAKVSVRVSPLPANEPSGEALADVLLFDASGLRTRVALKQEPLGGALVVAPAAADLGEGIAGRAAGHVITVGNAGTRPVDVMLKAPGSLALGGDAGALRLEPRASANVAVTVAISDAGVSAGALELATEDRLCGALPGPATVRASGVPFFAGDLALGDAFTCVRTPLERVACWGAAERGQVGFRLTGTSPLAVLPVPVPSVVAPVRLAAGAQHACALQRDGAVSCWGSNTFGQLARAADAPSGVGVVDAAKGAVHIAAGAGHSCVVRAGEVLCWGDNGRGQVGIASTGMSHVVRTPSRVPGVADAQAIAAGGQHTCALRASGEVTCWGANIGNVNEGGVVPEWRGPAAAGVADAVDVAVGVGHACAVRRAGTVACWGKGDRGQLGTGTVNATPAATPVAVASLDDAVAVAAGASFTCALKRGGRVACWGDNGSGQLALTGRAEALSPELVPGVEGASALATGAFHACARVGSHPVCGGFNTSAQLGVGAASASGAPARALPL